MAGGDSTQFLIDIAARMTGGDTAITQLTTLGQRLSATGDATKTFEATAKAAKSAAGDIASVGTAAPTVKLGKLKGALGDLGGPLGTTSRGVVNLLDAFEDLGESLGAAGGPIGLVIALTTAVAALAVGLVAGAFALGKWAVGLADARRNAALNVEALEQTDKALRGIGAVLPGITRETGLEGDALAAFAKKLAGAKVAAADMPEALRAVAIAEAGLAGQGDEFIAQLKAGKKSVGELAREAEQKFGGIVAKRMLSLGAQTAQLKRNLSDTFGGLNIDPLLQGMRTLVGLFDQQTAMGRTLKFVFEGIFQPIINILPKVAQGVEAFALGFAIAGLKIYIAMKPAIKAVSDLLGFESPTLTDALDAAALAGQALAIGIASVIAVLGGLAAVATAALAPLLFGFEIGSNLVKSLAAGITSGATAVINAITGVAQGAISAAKRVLGIASPSKVFEGIGDFTMQGLTEGVEGGAPAAQSAMGDAVKPPAAAGASTTSISRGGNTYSITINAPSGDGDGIAVAVRRVLQEITAGDLIELGGAAA